MHLGFAPEFTPNAHGFDKFLGHHHWTIGYYNHETEQGEPGIVPDNQVMHTPGIATDITATILDVAGLNYKTTDLDGMSLLPGLRADKNQPDRALFWRANLYNFGEQKSVRDGRYK